MPVNRLEVEVTSETTAVLFGRQLPRTTSHVVVRETPVKQSHFEHLGTKQEQQKTYNDEHARATPLSPVVPSQPVVIRNENRNSGSQRL